MTPTWSSTILATRALFPACCSHGAAGHDLHAYIRLIGISVQAHALHESAAAIGAGLSGVLGVGLFYCMGRDSQVLSVLSFGYGVLQDAMEDPARLSIAVLAAVALGKIVTTSLTIGSGGSGGVFGPSMVIGGCAGGALGLIFQRIWPNMHLQPVSFMIVGMAGFFAAAAKTPFSTLVMVCELTGDYRLIVPALWVCTLAFFLSDEQSLYDSQIESRNLSPAHQGSFVREALAGRNVAQVLSLAHPIEPLEPNENLQSVIERFNASPELILPVVGKEGDWKASSICMSSTGLPTAAMHFPGCWRPT